MDVWKKPTFDFLEGVAMRIEQKHGRLSVTNATKIDFDQRKKEIIHDIEAGPHFKQAPDQDFSNLPDPFGSYRSELSYKDFGLGQRDDQGLDYIEDPDHLSLMQREISRFRTKEMSKNDPDQVFGSENEPTPSSSTISRNPETEKDDKHALVMAKLADLRSNLSKEEKEEYEKFKTDPSKLKQSDTDDIIEVVGEKTGSTTRGSPMEIDKDGGRGGSSRKSAKLVYGRRPAAGNPLYDTGSNLKAFYNKESTSSSRDQRDHNRRRSRSRSAERRVRQRRSDSPFSVFYDNWKKFKQAERVMFDTVNRKKDIYDKRPEDHPQYPEEWRIFWEKRYKDLQAQGKDADNYDYKPDWIPYWAKKSEELYHEEIHIKTRDLLEKYGLKTGDEPNREQFMREFDRGKGDRDIDQRSGRTEV